MSLGTVAIIGLVLGVGLGLCCCERFHTSANAWILAKKLPLYVYMHVSQIVSMWRLKSSLTKSTRLQRVVSVCITDFIFTHNLSTRDALTFS